jgi:hypothetical protein
MNYKTETETRGTMNLSTEYRKYEVNIKQCNLDIFDTVTPETVIGCHYESGKPVKAGFRGQVATIYFNPMHDSLMVMVVAAVSRNN